MGYLIILSEANSTRRIKMFPHLAIKPILGQIFSTMSKKLKPVVPCVGHEDLILAVAGNIPWIHKLTSRGSLLSELENKLA